MRAPGPLLDDGGLIDPPNSSMGALAAGGRARPPNTSHSPASSEKRSPIWSCIGKTRRVAGGADSGFFSGRL